MPLQIAAIANSRTPKWIFFPCGVSLPKNSNPFSSVLLDGARSALPPNMDGKYFTSLLSTVPEQDRVAVFVFELENAIIVIKFFRQFCGIPAEQLGIEFRVTMLIFCNHRIVGIFTLAIICRKVGKIVINLGRHGERFIIPTDGFFHSEIFSSPKGEP